MSRRGRAVNRECPETEVPMSQSERPSHGSLQHFCRRGLTLLELLAVVIIIGVLALVVIRRISVASEDVKKEACFHNKAVINKQVEQYFFETGGWPANSLSDIGNDPNYFPDGIPTCPVNGTSYTLNPLSKRVLGHTHGGK